MILNGKKPEGFDGDSVEKFWQEMEIAQEVVNRFQNIEQWAKENRVVFANPEVAESLKPVADRLPDIVPCDWISENTVVVVDKEKVDEFLKPYEPTFPFDILPYRNSSCVNRPAFYGMIRNLKVT